MCKLTIHILEDFMALTLQTIINFIETPFHIKLLAGREGLKKNVSWVYYTEDASTIEFIRGGELAVTLGINYERQKDNLNITDKNHLHVFLQEYIDNFITHGGTGLIINVGKYISEVPQSIIEYCDEKQFPLFTMPWEIHTIDLMQEVGNMISSDNQNANTVEKYFYRSIFEKDKFDKAQIANTPFWDAKLFSVVLMEFEENLFNQDVGKIKRHVLYSFNQKIGIQQNLYCCFIHKQKVVYIIKDSNEQFLAEILNAQKSDKHFINSVISVSDYCDDVTEMEEIYKHANVALQINSQPGKINYYANLGIYKIIVGVKNKKILRQFYKDNLGKLDEMEPEKREDFLKTLSLYLKNGGNILKVAELNNAHRNTVLYRINRLEELLGVDLSDGEVRTSLQVALYLRTISHKLNVK